MVPAEVRQGACGARTGSPPVSAYPWRWHAGDPEPDQRITTVRTVNGDLWWRVRPYSRAPEHAGYTWWNGDKLRTWPMLTNNRGPVHNVARLAALHTAYRRRRA